MRGLSQALTIALLLTPVSSLAADPNRQADEKAIRGATANYIAALARGDVKTLLDHWTADGEIVDEFGRATPARKLIEQEAKETAESGAPVTPIKASDSRLRFLTADVALEEGRVEPTAEDAADGSLPGQFSAVWVKQGDRWRLANLRESRVPVVPAVDLAGLDWMIGKWTGELDGTTYVLTAHWNEKHTFLERELTVSREGKTVTSGLQHIGFDPADGQIHSWMHDSEGGHGDGLWSQQGNTWVVRSSGIDGAGERTSGTTTYTPVEANRLLWKSLGGRVGDQTTGGFEVTLTKSAPAEK